MLAAQQSAQPKALTIERIAEERELTKALPHDTAWVPAGKRLSFIKALRNGSKAGPGAAEICRIDVLGSHEQVIVSAAEIATALKSTPSRPQIDGDSDEDAKREQLESYAWAPDGIHLLLASSEVLSWFDLATHSSRSLVNDGQAISHPEISPDGLKVSFIRAHTLWLVDIATGSARAFAGAGEDFLRVGEPDWVYAQEFGLHAAYWWSPDSSSVAWFETNDRAVGKYTLRGSDGSEKPIAYPKPAGAIPAIRLFVQAVSGSKPQQIDLGNSQDLYIPRVQWLPDSKHLVIERLSRDQKTLDLLRADIATGRSTVLLTEKDLYWINVGDELHFLKDSRRFVWSSERSGFKHLYLYDVSGRQLAQLTEGNWVVDSLAGVDEAEGVVFFTASEAGPAERQVYRVNLDGSNFKRISKQSGNHDAQLSPSGDTLLDLWSSWSTAPQVELLRSDGRSLGVVSRDLQPGGELPQLPAPEFLTVKNHMGLAMNALMIRPPDFDSSRTYPVIVYVAGGPGEQAVRNAWGGDIHLWFSLMAQKGYVVFAVDNRGSSGSGHLFEEPVHLRLSGVEMADQRDGVLYLRSLPFVDKSRIGICGWGYGGFLALHGMLDRPLLFSAGFAGSPVTDWHTYDAVFTERYLEDPTRNQDGWLASSPLENARYLRSPLLIAQATLDEKVHLENSLLLLDELLDKGMYPDTLLFPDRRDLFEDRNERLVLFQKMTDFFSKNL